MKKLEHIWDNEFFLMHIELESQSDKSYFIYIKRKLGYEILVEEKHFDKTNSRPRFIISRTHPKEKGLIIEYPDEIILTAYKIDDRAYYPTQYFYRF
ncbi:hypothetical protein [Pectinatus haikarae]|uniref:hypothetical protein n=1 Tax=Pectinatus haikarae TaxID=349096 RepID=UPI0018C72A21|nr:hypothetical protein [Pectinatus haikarae]